jgi:hypothetical protein
MTKAKGYFDEVQMTECKISSFEFIGSDLVIYIDKGIELYKPHPLAGIISVSEPCKIIFANVMSSIIVLDIYAGDPSKDGFKEEKKVTHQVNPDCSLQPKFEDFFVEGILLNPLSWVSWNIVAETVFIDDLKP